ncbi:hypothetical protein UFOVP68_50 [uncultured Caudovirales phage]|uniref:Uncharacterized protein n=1 Tax=uncultured Caudovirales phage TaxID=2100421 RepID=A0A6J5KUG9_9CAUD|nr:hypothetical protein UFOVP68_50 [uncultured Caudovirales phage]
MTYKTISRAALARYAALLGRGSIAARALASYDAARAGGLRPVAQMSNAAFRVTTAAAGAQVFA